MTSTTRPAAAALRRAPRPGAPPLSAALRPRLLPAGDDLRLALQVLQLRQPPGSLAALMVEVSERHPRLERTWSWRHAAAYSTVFDAVAAATGAAATSSFSTASCATKTQTAPSAWAM